MFTRHTQVSCDHKGISLFEIHFCFLSDISKENDLLHFGFAFTEVDI